MTEPNSKNRVSEFVWPVRVYWEDTDGGGVVYHSQYLNFFERARTEWLRSRGIHQARIAAEEGVVFAIRRMQVDWLLPARLDDVLNVSVHTVTAGASRLEFRQDMHRQSDEALVATAEVMAVCLDATQFKPIKMPEHIRTEIKNVQ